MKVLVTGGTGSLGSEIVKKFRRDCTVVAPSHASLDVTIPSTVNASISAAAPDIVIHTAAMIDVRLCEQYPMNAQKVNAIGTYNVAKATLDIGAKLIHISTACVFDGEYAPFDELSTPRPKNWYALTKFASEQIVMALPLTDRLIVRTNFVPRVPWKYPKAFIDRFGSYLFAEDVACALRYLTDMKGVVHVCGSKRMSMYELAKMVSPEVEPMSMDEYHGPPLTRDMTLTSRRIDTVNIGCAKDAMFTLQD